MAMLHGHGLMVTGGGSQLRPTCWAGSLVALPNDPLTLTLTPAPPPPPRPRSCHQAQEAPAERRAAYDAALRQLRELAGSDKMSRYDVPLAALRLACAPDLGFGPWLYQGWEVRAAGSWWCVPYAGGGRTGAGAGYMPCAGRQRRPCRCATLAAIACQARQPAQCPFPGPPAHPSTPLPRPFAFGALRQELLKLLALRLCAQHQNRDVRRAAGVALEDFFEQAGRAVAGRAGLRLAPRAACEMTACDGAAHGGVARVASYEGCRLFALHVQRLWCTAWVAACKMYRG